MYSFLLLCLKSLRLKFFDVQNINVGCSIGYVTQMNIFESIILLLLAVCNLLVSQFHMYIYNNERESVKVRKKL